MIEWLKSEIKRVENIQDKHCSDYESCLLQCLEKAEELEKNLKDKIDEAQEDYANLDWVSKQQAIKIIEKEFHKKELVE